MEKIASDRQIKCMGYVNGFWKQNLKGTVKYIEDSYRYVLLCNIRGPNLLIWLSIRFTNK